MAAARRRTPYRILLPLANPRTARDLVRIGAGVANGRPTEITALGIVEVPEGVSLSEGATQARTSRRLLQRVLAFGDEEGVELRTLVRIGRHAADGVIEAVGEEGSDLVIFGWGGPPTASQAARADAEATEMALAGHRTSVRPVFSPTIDAVVRESPCDIAVVKQRGLDRVSSILVPVRGGPHAELAMRISRDLARRFGAKMVVLHVVPKGVGERAVEREQSAVNAFVKENAGSRRATGLIREATSVRQAIIREAANHDLVVMGASAQPTNASPDGRYLFGTLAESVASKAKPTVIVVKTKQSVGLATFEELRASEGTLAHADAFVERSRSLPVVVDKWFAENTFHAHEFSEIRKLVALKERHNLTISLGLPALNEEKTIGTVIKRVKGALMDRVPLIDQMVLIDSDSEDRTVEIATELGVPVFKHAEILPETGTHRGKGEALWKSLHVLDGDIVAWVDTDISNIQPRFVYGLIGPLLVEPKILYVKGFYQRPIRSGDTLHAEGGGRVTELMARPLINLFFPELSGMIQPLSGEYAGRRELLESLPFFTGYAVEIGLLIDILEHAGISALGQVDLERRIHRNQSLPNLSQMAYVILQGAIRKLEERHRIELLTEVGRGMKLINTGKDHFSLEVREIGDEIRPPILTIPAYVERRRALKVR
ncbi:MAG: glucosyl-3-phosphoglycerate synthase [Chloroflexi bacterium]|nr:glucosyl-3-phosphoglycerate synthase [Chloroflexota bacterium]MBA3739557.1 glucosyl-3-phosphoglycerate synthase [Chloroflexota bacterium]